jgi:hypothetical protein
MHEQFTRFVLLQSVGGQKKQWESPNTRSMKFNVQFTKDRETKNLQKSALASKVVNPFTRAHAPPFIGRRMDFYIPTIPSNLGNIPNVNMHTNVFYIPWFTGLISYIYKLGTSSHLKPGLSIWHLWLCSFLIPRISFSRRSPLAPATESDLHQLPELRRSLIIAGSRFQIFATSWFQNFTSFNYPKIDSKLARRSQIRLSFSHIVWKREKHLKLIRIPSWMFHFHETGVLIPRVIREFISRISANPTFQGCKVFS